MCKQWIICMCFECINRMTWHWEVLSPISCHWAAGGVGWRLLSMLSSKKTSCLLARGHEMHNYSRGNCIRVSQRQKGNQCATLRLLQAEFPVFLQWKPKRRLLPPISVDKGCMTGAGSTKTSANLHATVTLGSPYSVLWPLTRHLYESFAFNVAELYSVSHLTKISSWWNSHVNDSSVVKSTRFPV